VNGVVQGQFHEANEWNRPALSGNFVPDFIGQGGAIGHGETISESYAESS
jgi:hypothetical protein